LAAPFNCNSAATTSFALSLQLWGKLLEIRNAKASVKLDYDKRVREITHLEEVR
jgi:hypothetical protein